MINAWNLIWIVPVSGAVGFMCAALCTVTKQSDKAAERMNRRQNDE